MDTLPAVLLTVATPRGTPGLLLLPPLRVEMPNPDMPGAPTVVLL